MRDGRGRARRVVRAWRRLLAYRRGAFAALAALSVVVTACAVFAPMYSQSVKESTVRSYLTSADIRSRGIEVVSSSDVAPTWTVGPEELADSLPPGMTQFFPTHVPAISIQFRLVGRGPSAPAGMLLWREGACGQIRLAEGRCPTARFEVAISAADAAWRHLSLGSTVTVNELPTAQSHEVAPVRTLRVVGIYSAQKSSAYWYGLILTGRSGRVEHAEPPQLDVWLTGAATMAGPPAEPGKIGLETSWMDRHSSVDFLLDVPAVTMANAGSLDQAVTTYLTNPTTRLARSQATGVVLQVRAGSGIPDVLGRVISGAGQVDRIVALVTAQLVVLALVALWLALRVLFAAMRTEVAVDRLHGLSVTQVRRRAWLQVLAVLVLAVPVGVGLALLAWVVARRLWLNAGAHFVVPAPSWLALAGAVLVMAALAWLAARDTARQPIVALLGTAPPVSRRGPQAGELVVVVLAVGGFLLLLSGSLAGPGAVLAPSLLAVGVGFLIPMAVPRVFGGIGSRLLRRRRTATAVGLLLASRQVGMRRAFAAVTVATTLLVFASDAVAVSDRNQRWRAEAETGAVAVVETAGGSLVDVQAALTQVDPQHRWTTPFVLVRAGDATATATVAVDPAQFAAMATWPEGRTPDLRRLALPTTAPVVVTGTTVSAVISSSELTLWSGETRLGPTTLLPVTLQLGLVNANGERLTVAFPAVSPRGSAPHRVTAAAPCAAGCRLASLQVFNSALQPPMAGSLTIADLTAGDRQVALGPAADWQGLLDSATAGSPGGGDQPGATKVESFDGASLTVSFTTGSTNPLSVEHTDVPIRMPALVAGPLPPGADGRSFVAPGLDGVDTPMTEVGSLAYIPGAPAHAALLNLALLQRVGAESAGTSASVRVLATRDDPAQLTTLQNALAAHNVTATATTTTAQALRAFRQTPTVWTLYLAQAVGYAALLLAAAVLLLVTGSTRPTRRRDYAGVRLGGLTGRVVRGAAVVEMFTLPLVAVVVGWFTGIVGARLAIAQVPIFATPPTLPTTDLGLATTAVGAAGLVSVVVVLVLCLLSLRRDLRGLGATDAEENP